MEHVLATGQTPWASSRLYAREPLYDGGDFFSYPYRQGWGDVSFLLPENKPRSTYGLLPWLKENLPNREVVDFVAFLQSWLYFGFLHCVIGIPVKELGAFVSKDMSSITTQSLSKYLVEWRPLEEHGSISELLLFLQSRGFETAEQYTKALFSLLDSVVWGSDPSSIFAPLFHISWSTALLIESLKTLINRSSHKYENLKLPRSSALMGYLELWLLQQGWCSSTIRQVSMIGAEGMIMTPNLGSVRLKDDHSLCFRSHCVAARTPEMGRHVDEKCDCALVLSPIQQVVELLEQGLIPVMVASEVDGVYSLSATTIYSRYSRQAYTAVSHVWADGLGSLRENGIRSCQLRRLVSAFRMLQGTRVTRGTATEPAFWLDTLCIPVDERYQHLRQFSISKMRHIFTEAEEVLIFDADFLNLSEEANAVDVAMTIHMSLWSRRLWTYQEAAFAKDLWILGDAHVRNLAASIKRLESAEVNPWRAKMKTTLYGALLYNVIQGGSQGATLDLGAILDTEEVFPARDVQIVLHALSQRATSREEDETVCIASSLGLDTTNLTRLFKETSEETEEARMQVFLEMLPFIPTNLLFASGPRLQQAGVRWAPRNIVRACQRTKPFRYIHNAIYPPADCWVPNCAFPPVPDMYPKWSKRPWPATWLHPEKGQGLVAYLPAIHVTMTGLFQRKHLPATYSLVVQDPLLPLWVDDGKNVELSPDHSFAVLMSKPLERFSDVNWTYSVLVEYEDCAATAGFREAKYLDSIILKNPPVYGQEPANADRFPGAYLGACWWLID